MQHDYVLKKFDFLPLDTQGSGESVGFFCCCIFDTLQFDMQHDHELKRLNFDILTSFPGSMYWVGLGGDLWANIATLLLHL